MSARASLSVGMVAAAVTSCRGSKAGATPTIDAVEPMSLMTALEHEIAEVQAALQGWTVLSLLLVLAIAIGVAVLLAALARRAQRSGRPRARLVSVGALTLDLALLVWLAFAVVRQFLDIAPIATMGALLLGAGGALFAAIARIRDWLAGLALAYQGRLREGDLLQTADASGVVERIGAGRVVLRRSDGARTYVRLHALAASDFTVASPRGAHPVELVLRGAGSFTAEDRRALRAIATLCPFRDLATPVTVTSPPGDDHIVAIHIHAWSMSAAGEAEAHLRAALEKFDSTKCPPAETVLVGARGSRS